MRIEYHPAIEGELREIQSYYEDGSLGWRRSLIWTLGSVRAL